MKAKGCKVYLSGNKPGFTLPSNIGELGDDIVNLDLSQCSLRGITCRVAPALRDGTESEIAHTFPFPAVCTGPSLDETLRMLKPLAPTLMKLNLGDNELGGTITDDIAASVSYTHLTLPTILRV